MGKIITFVTDRQLLLYINLVVNILNNIEITHLIIDQSRHHLVRGLVVSSRAWCAVVAWSLVHLQGTKIIGAHGWKKNIWCTLVEQEYLEHMGGKNICLYVWKDDLWSHKRKITIMAKSYLSKYLEAYG